MIDPHTSSATDLATAIRRREIGCLELLEACVARIERLNPALNAVVTLDLDRARARAPAADEAHAHREDGGPQHGRPITRNE
jgi:amidase